MRLLCRLRMYRPIWLLGLRHHISTGPLPQDPAGGLPFPRPPVSTLPPNPGYVTVGKLDQTAHEKKRDTKRTRVDEVLVGNSRMIYIVNG